MNEFAIMFDKMNIETLEVLKAAKTKWNFLNFTPGLVGGHCISVDPYYLSYKSRKLGFNPDLILTARKINNNVPDYIVFKTKLQTSLQQLHFSHFIDSSFHCFSSFLI